MSCRFTLRRTFPELEACLLDDIQKAAVEDPFGRKWVLTSSGTLARHLRKCLEQRIEHGESFSVGGIRIVSLSLFSVEVFKKLGRTRPHYSSPLHSLLLDFLVHKIPDHSPLAPLKDIVNGYSLLVPTFQDLADAGFSSAEGEFLMESVEEGAVSNREKEILSLYFSWIDMVRETGEAWAPLSQQDLAAWIEDASPEEVASALASESGRPVRIFVHGFYDFTDNNLQILAGLGKSQEVTLYFPDNTRGNQIHPAFEFSRPMLDDMRARVGIHALDEPREFGGRDNSFPSAEFFDRTFPDGKVAAQPPFLTFQRASSPRAEALSAALRVRSWIDEDGIDPDEVMVVFTSPGGYLGPILDAFEEFCLPVNVIDFPVEISRESLRRTQLARLWRESAPAEWVFQYLRENPAFCLSRGIDAFQFERRLRSVVFGGGGNWRQIRNLFDGSSGGGRDTGKLNEEETGLVDEIIGLWIDKPQFPVSSGKAAELTGRILSWAGGEDESMARVRDAFSSWAGVMPGAEISEELFVSLIFESAGEEKTGNDISAPGVKLIPMMRARGITCRAMVLIGLSSGLFPRKVEEDYFLADQSRAEVVRRSGELGHRMPLKSRLTDEMALLFYLLNTSSQLVHWVIPETDSTGRLVTPTSWIQNYVQQWDSGRDPMQGRVPPAPTEQSRFMWGLDPAAGSFLPPSRLFLVGSGLVERITGFEGIPDCWKPFTKMNRKSQEFYGQVKDASFPRSGDVLNVTSIETLARCPYRFFGEKLLEIAPLEVQNLPDSLNPLDRGSALHRALERLLRDHRDASAAFLEELNNPERIREEVRKSIAEIPSSRMLPSLFKSALADQMAGLIAEYFSFALERVSEGRVFARFEEKMQSPFPGLPEISLKGKADRIDRISSTGALHITDYKAGRRGYLDVNKNQDTVIGLGWMAQASLYRWMASESGEAGEIAFSYVFLGEEEKRKKEVLAESSIEPGRLLASLEGILTGGDYLPSGNTLMDRYGLSFLEPCRYCRLMSMCRRIDPEERGRMAELFIETCRERASLIAEASEAYPRK